MKGSNGGLDGVTAEWERDGNCCPPLSLADCDEPRVPAEQKESLPVPDEE